MNEPINSFESYQFPNLNKMPLTLCMLNNDVKIYKILAICTNSAKPKVGKIKNT